MIVVVGRFRLPPSQVERAKPLMARVIDASLAEAGCLEYSYAEDVCDAGLFRVSEAWKSHQALEAHFASEHMRQWQQEREALGFHDRQVIAHEAGESWPL
jgi:quinol monooxygenase YgiN